MGHDFAGCGFEPVRPHCATTAIMRMHNRFFKDSPDRRLNASLGTVVFYLSQFAAAFTQAFCPLEKAVDPVPADRALRLLI